jgi:thymidylate synthase
MRLAHLIHLENLRDGYIQLIEHVRTKGRPVAPRDQPTLEIEDATIVVEHLDDVLPIGINRKLNLDIAAIEALQLIGQRSDPELVLAASPNFKEFMEEDGHFHGAYGPRAHGQVDAIVNKLRMDRLDRRALLTLWRPSRDNERGFRDYPCTIALGFRIRDDKLNLSVTMRSNDVWLGTAFDIFQFSQLQYTIARMLDIEVGTYAHVAWSLHLYERDIGRSEQLTPPTEAPTSLHPLGFANYSRATMILRAEVPEQHVPFDLSEAWYAERMTHIRSKVKR